MSDLPGYRPFSAIYALPKARQKSPNSKDLLRTEDDILDSRPRVSSTGNNVGYEGLIFDRSPQETERISRRLNTLIDQKTGSSSTFLGVFKNKSQSKTDVPLRKSSSPNHRAANSSTTIFSRRQSTDGVSSDSALVCHGNCSEQNSEEEEGKLPLDLYAFVVDNPEKAYTQFMQAHMCYDIIPTNAKIVILDTNLDVRKAFHALVYNSVRAALLWSPAKQHLCGMLTITDFILILLRLYRTEKESISTNLEKQLIREWRELLKKEGKLKKLASVTANTSLYRAVKLLSETNYHRIPVMDEKSGNPLYFLTHKRILRFLYLYLEQLPRPKSMDETIRDLGVGTYKELQFVYPDTPLVECLAKLTARHMSAMPVVEKDTNVVVDIYARFDAIGLATQQTYGRLDKTVAEALQHRKLSNWYEGVLTCLETDKFWDVLTKLVVHEVHGLVIVNKDNVLRGVLTLSDVLRFLVLRPIFEKDE